jgi:hypothetical protein
MFLSVKYHDIILYNVLMHMYIYIFTDFTNFLFDYIFLECILMMVKYTTDVKKFQLVINDSWVSKLSNYTSTVCGWFDIGDFDLM